MVTGVVSLGLAIIAGVLIHQRCYAGYPPAPAGLGVLNRGEAAFVAAAAEVMFPTSAPLAVSGAEARLPHFVDRYLDGLPRMQRLEIRALFGLLEHGTLCFPGPEPGGRGRFSSLSAASRIAILERLAEHRSGLMRLLVTALRAVFVLGYLGHPANLAALGLAPFAIEPVVSEAELLFPRIGGLPGSIAFGPEDRNDEVARGPLSPSAQRHPAYRRAGRGPA